MLIGLPLWAQQTVSGNVTSEDGPLPGAFVMVKGSSQGTSTDEEGNYAIEVCATDTLQYSYIGYATLEEVVGNRSLIDVNLTTGNQLDEVVVVGYGTVRKLDLTGSVSSVKTEGIEEIPQVSVSQILTGKVAGVNISQSSGQVGSGVRQDVERPLPAVPHRTSRVGYKRGAGAKPRLLA